MRATEHMDEVTAHYRVLVDISSTNELLLLARTTRGRVGSLESDLYVAGADGADPRPIYSYSGGFHGAQFSPEGDYILVTTYAPSQDGQSEQVAVVLLNIKANIPPRLLARKTTTDTDRTFFISLGSAFLRKGSDKELVVVADVGLSSTALSIFDPLSPASALARVTVDGTPYRLFRADSFDSDGSIVLVWQTRPSSISSAGCGRVMVLDVAVRGEAQLYSFGQAAQQVLTGAWLREHHLLYSSYSLSTEVRQPRRYFMNSVPLADIGSEWATGKTIYDATVPASQPYSLPVSVNWYLGSGPLSYITNGSLRVRTFDARGASDTGIDLPLESGVTQIYQVPAPNTLALR